LAGCWLASYAVSTTGIAPLAGALTCTGSWAGELAADTGGRSASSSGPATSATAIVRVSDDDSVGTAQRIS